MIKKLVANPFVRKVTKIVLEVLVILFGLIMLGLYYSEKVFYINKKEGFYCEDASIRYPFTSAKNDLVSHDLVYVVGLIIGCILIIVVELFQPLKPSYKSTSKIPKFVLDLIYALVIYLFGFVLAYSVVGCFKLNVGRLRPYFLDMCQPNVNCSLPENHNKFHTGFKCINEKAINKSWISFPSGHTTDAFYFMVFLAIYLQKRMTSEVTMLLRCLLQFLAIFFAVFTALSRFIAHKHHPTDLLAGAAVGIAIAVPFALWLPSFLQKDDDSKPDVEAPAEPKK